MHGRMHGQEQELKTFWSSLPDISYSRLTRFQPLTQKTRSYEHAQRDEPRLVQGDPYGRGTVFVDCC